jgi:polar amino acid transport system permease protein
LRFQYQKVKPLDILLILLLVGIGLFFFYRIRMGLDYKWRWEVIPQYLFYFDSDRGRWLPNLLMKGLFNTIRLSIWGTILATILGTILGLFRISKALLPRLLSRTYVEFIRNLPPLVLIFIFYFFISDQIMPVLGIDTLIRSSSPSLQKVLTFPFAPPAQFSAFLSAVITLALFEGAYIAEIIRAGIQSIEKGQWEAGYALGLSWWNQMRDVIMPQAIQRILPPLTGQFISTIKDSAIVSVISIQELTFQGMELMSSTYLTFEIWITITALYLLLTLSLSLAVGRLEHRLGARY